MEHSAGQDTIQVAAALVPAKLQEFDPLVRSLLAGTQIFIKQADGRYRPRGCAMGLAQCFELADLIVHPA